MVALLTYRKAALFLLAASSLFAELTFVHAPSMVAAGSGAWTISFELSENSDAEVSIVRTTDSSVVRHLAAGLLGATPPPPFAANSRAQTLTWNGLDDFGKVAANPEQLSVRVRAGMSPKLVALAAEELFAFNQGTLTVVPDKDGSVFMLGKAGSSLKTSSTFLRKYDGSGNYIKTIFPPSADLPSDSVTTYGINLIPGVGWSPRTTQISADRAVSPRITNALLNNIDAQLLAVNDKDELIIASGLQTQNVRKSGSLSSSSTPLIVGPPQTGSSAFELPPFGPHYISPSNNPKYLYLSGWFYGTIDGNYFLATADTSGLWGDGKILKLDVTTGIASPWLKLDSVPVTAAQRATKLGTSSGAGNFSAIHGVTVDDLGHVFVCDRLHRRVSVYDTLANFLGSISCPNADLVSVSKRTGCVYVLKRALGSMVLVKYPGWQNNPSLVTSDQLTTSVVMTGRYEPATPSMSLVEVGNTTNIYVGYQTVGFRLYSDNGTTLELLKDFSQNINGSLTFERIAVDRKTDKVFWTHGGRDNVPNFVISNWANPVPYLAQTFDKQPFLLDNITVAPNGMLYGSPLGHPSYPSFVVPVVRFTNDSLPRPANYTNTGKNIISSGIGYEGGSIGSNHRGVAVGWQGQVAVYEEYEHLLSFPDTGYSDTAFKGTPLITVPNATTNYRVVMNCVKFDPAGNYYVGVIKREADAIIPAGFASDNLFTNYTGSVMKFAAGTTGIVNAVSYGSVASVVGATKVYPQPFGLFSGDNSSLCNCRNTYFDVDPYGRLFIPSAGSSQIYIADNAGNTLKVFGQYGNTDSRGRLGGPGETTSKPDIPIGWSTSVAASEDFVYIADAVNARIVRVQMTYALDNIPGLTEHNASTENGSVWDAFKAEASPNPFNPISRIRIQLPAAGKLHLSVYRADGRFIRDIATGNFGAGIHDFVWRADNNQGKKVASGLYVYRIRAGEKITFLKTMLLK